MSKSKRALLCFLPMALTFTGCNITNNESGRFFESNLKPKYLFSSTDKLLDANDESFRPNNTPKISSPLEDKTFYWLGDSVTFGYGSNGEAVPEYLSALTGCQCVKDAVSGTKIQWAKDDSQSFVSRLVHGNIFQKDKSIDAFFVQISVNDVTNNFYVNMGNVTSEETLSLSDFDTATTIGGLEYIINFVEETWNCPIYLCTQNFYGDNGPRKDTYFNSQQYNLLLDKVYDTLGKYSRHNDFSVSIIDLYDDLSFNEAISDDYFKWCMLDPIHPKRAAYRNWWAPYFQAFLEQSLV